MFKRPVPDTYASKSAPSRFDLILLLQLSSLRSSTTVKRLQFERKSETLRREWSEMPPWILCNENGKLLDPSRVRKVFQRALKGAGLPLHFHAPCLRHTFTSLMLQQGESPVYVQRQLGRSSIKLTIDTYGKWLPMGEQASGGQA